MFVTARAWIWIQAKTTLHKARVAHYLLRYAVGGSSAREACSLLLRAVCHDVSKYRRAEAVPFVEWYLLPVPREDSPRYESVLIGLDRQAELHYARNRHHPEHHSRGYDGMSELDRVEMVADWAAAARRLGPPESVERWIDDRADRYGYGPKDAARLRTIAVRIGTLSTVSQFHDICRAFPSGRMRTLCPCGRNEILVGKATGARCQRSSGC